MGLQGVGFIGLCLLFVGTVQSASIEIIDSSPPVNSRFCVRGPSYWCKNITTAKDCNAVKHCIQTVWEQQTLPADNDNVCQICKDMVAQARAQLESNETQEELREVFEGSCKLIPISIVQKECIKLSDEFIPELVETLASQMNPQAVCAVAGLCNNARIDALLSSSSDSNSDEISNEITSPEKCHDCSFVARQIEQNLLRTPKETILNNFVEACGRLGSFSDGCAAVVITHFESLYSHLMKNFNGDGLCHLSGMCQFKFHTHEPDETIEGIEVVHTSSVGMLKPEKKDGACEMCQQLVLHLRDFLVANTTETEFEQVLKGLCGQFKSFKAQCLSIVEEYYAVFYDFLVSELDAKGAKELCSLLAICRPPTVKGGPLWPLVPTEAVHNYEAHKAAAGIPESRPIVGQDEANSMNILHRVPLNGDGVGVRIADGNSWAAPLPVERMLPQSVTYVSNKQLCTFCEYLLHYLQVALTSPATESEIRKVVGEACDHLPHTIDDQCRSFVDTYGDALVALLAQEIDPSQVCPKLGLCPESQVLVDLTHVVNDKPTCPLCLFAVEELVTKLKDNKTEEGIRKALDELCEDLPKSLVGECRTFVENYSEELVDMIVADFTPQEVCSYLKLCDPPSISSAPVSSVDEIMTNDVQLPIKRLLPQTVVNAELEQMQSNVEDSTSCVLCEFVLSKIDSALKDKTTEDEIKHVVHDVCNWMPKTVVAECNKFVDQYADLVITLLAQNIDPKEVCTEIKLCASKLQHVPDSSLDQCVMCDALMGALEGAMQDPTIDKDAAKALQKMCTLIPKKDEDKCKSMVKIYGPSILNLLARETPINYICEKLGLCPQNRQVVGLLGGKRCTWGPGYWCQSVSHAKACGAIAHCQERVWKADKPAE
ncbi:Uncharacterized protein GBIM_18364 [Gryllus bimaculatus]|nr:Uncharacterized protein GBIM_18364 [Gryllus bimaculatus]